MGSNLWRFYQLKMDFELDIKRAVVCRGRYFVLFHVSFLIVLVFLSTIRVKSNPRFCKVCFIVVLS